MFLTIDEQKLHGMAQLLVHNNLLEKSKAIELHKAAATEHISLIQYLVKYQILTAEQIAQTASQNFGVPMMDISCIEIKSIPVHLITDQLIRRHAMIPLFNRGTNLYLATDDPSKQNALKEIQSHTGLNTHAMSLKQTNYLYLLKNY